MIAIRRILCPVDLSDYSRRALDHVIAIARWYKSTVTVLRVFAAAGPGTIVLEPIVLTPVDRDQLLAETKALAEGHADCRDAADASRTDGPATPPGQSDDWCGRLVRWGHP